MQGNPVNLADPKGLTGIGGGAYFGGGAEASYSSSTCCEGETRSLIVFPSAPAQGSGDGEQGPFRLESRH